MVDNDFYKFEYEAAQQLIIMRRTSLSLAVASRDRILADVIAALRPLRGQRLLIDVRLAPGSNAPAMEEGIQRFRTQLSKLFPISATLAATAVGRLQLNRMSRERGDFGSTVFFEEAEARAHLMSREL